MSDPQERGPAVDASEDTPDWWVSEENRPSSAAFDEPKFSVNIASLTTFEATTQQLQDGLGKIDGGIVAFNCGHAREHGFDARSELDELFPENDAHAHVYYDGSKSSRKKNARRLVKHCHVVLQPTF